MTASSPDSGAPAPRQSKTAPRLAALRAELKRQNLDGFILPRGDEHQGEYVPPRAERLRWLTGFAGSAGLAIALADRAAIFVDGRYTLQVASQVDTSLFEVQHVTDQPPGAWLGKHVGVGARIGYDPWLFTEEGLTRYRQVLEGKGASLVATERNPIDAAWADQPSPPAARAVRHDLAFAGQSAADKRAAIAAKLAEDGLEASVISAPDSLAWLLNIRGGDVPHTPLALGFAVLRRDSTVDLLMDARKIDGELRAHLGNAVRVAPPEEFGPVLDALGAGKSRVLVDQSTAAAWIGERLVRAGASVIRGQDPCALPKACKNPVELENARRAHRRDGATLTGFLAWVAREAPKGAITEIDAADKLDAMRATGEHFRDTSFTTISGAGSNGAIVHYRVTRETNRALAPGMLYLVDSGAQYLDATTDVTRTIAIGTPGAEERDRFTRVLKGHIALARAVFPAGTTGSQLDALARAPLWQAGLDFDHGTGHGVGSYLSVHEGPQRISKLPNTVALRPGMIVSNEPGYYKTGAYGIRIENLVAVREIEAPPGSERKLLGFETLTLAPIDRALIDTALMTQDEIAWINDYHARVRASLSPLLDDAARAFLIEATNPV